MRKIKMNIFYLPQIPRKDAIFWNQRKQGASLGFILEPILSIFGKES
jgi:hypothetical protein